MVPVERSRRFILRVNQQGIGCDFGADRAIERIGQERSTQSLSPEPSVDRQASHTHSVYFKDIAAASFQDGTEDPTAADLPTPAYNIQRCAFRPQAPQSTLSPGVVLRDLSPEILVQRLGTAIKRGAVTGGIKRHDSKPCTPHSSPSNLRRRAKARSRAGTGPGGDRSACAKHS